MSGKVDNTLAEFYENHLKSIQSLNETHINCYVETLPLETKWNGSKMMWAFTTFRCWENSKSIKPKYSELSPAKL